jgi:hypothetical protein
MEAMKGVEPLSTGLQDRRSGIQLSYIAEEVFELCTWYFVSWVAVRRLGTDKSKVQAQSTKYQTFGGLGGSQTLTRSLQDFYAIVYITSPEHLSFVIGHFSFAISCVLARPA